MEIFTDFYSSLVHPGYNWVPRAHAVVRWTVNMEQMDTLIERNIPGKHVVHVVLENMFPIIEIKKQEAEVQAQQENEAPPKKLKVGVTLYMNYSPCNSTRWPANGGPTCCDALIAFKNREDVDVTLRVVFVSLYKILRDSCLEQCIGQHHAQAANFPNSEQNKQGLRNVNAAGIELKTFTPEDWNFLRGALGVDVNSEAYQAILEEVSQEDRNMEDMRMENDLQEILGQEDEDEGEDNDEEHEQEDEGGNVNNEEGDNGDPAGALAEAMAGLGMHDPQGGAQN